MSALAHISTATSARADTRRDQPYLWTTVLVLGVIAACAIAASFYVDPPLFDVSMVGP
jgi:hypothetical protein